jgi:hypothetical protein
MTPDYSAQAGDPRTKVIYLLPIRNVGGVSLVRQAVPYRV